MNPEMRLLALGDLNLDMLCRVDHWPKPGEDIIATAIQNKAGGSAANTAAAFVACGGSAALIARVGSDFLAREVLAELEKLGVDVSRVQRGADATTGMAFVAVGPDGERTMFGHRGANTELDPSHIHREWFLDFDLFHLSGYALLRNSQRAAALRSLQCARDRSMPVSLDIGGAAAAICVEVLDQIDILLASRSELPGLCGTSDPAAAIRRLTQMGPSLAVVKLGSEGALIGTARDLVNVPAAQLAASDTTGAGDLFNAGFLFGHLSRMSPNESAALGNGLAALGIAANGPGRPLPSGPSLVHWLEALVLPSAPPALARHLQTACRALAAAVH